MSSYDSIRPISFLVTQLVGRLIMIDQTNNFKLHQYSMVIIFLSCYLKYVYTFRRNICHINIRIMLYMLCFSNHEKHFLNNSYTNTSDNNKLINIILITLALY